MTFNFIELKENIRIKGDKINVGTMVIRGKDGNYFVCISPALNVSGYGETEEEAKESFMENIDLFCSDLMILSKEKIEHELFKLGLRREKYKTKNFSKLYVRSEEHTSELQSRENLVCRLL